MRDGNRRYGMNEAGPVKKLPRAITVRGVADSKQRSDELSDLGFRNLISGWTRPLPVTKMRGSVLSIEAVWSGSGFP